MTADVTATASRAEPATSFVGREPELAEGERLLAGTRMLTVTGPGGTGKTRYATELARRVERGYETGRVQCLFASLRDPKLVLPTIAHAFGIAERGGSGALESIAERIGESQALLFLDNLEHLLAASPELAELVAACPRLTVLCTSRQRLGVESELAYELPPLGADESVALFCERAAVAPSAGVRELCARLEGLPLAIELAAARLPLVSPEQLLARLGSRLDLLRARATDPRQETLRATIQWSYDLLEPHEQRLFAALSVFAGGCTPELAGDVCGGDADTLASLVDKSLVRAGEGRFSMLETIRQFAAERLEESGTRDALGRRHAECMAAMVATISASFDRGIDPLAALGPDRENIRLALAFASETDRHELGLRLVASSWPLWYASGASQEGRRWADAFLGPTEGERSTTRANALVAASIFACWTGDLADAERYAAESLPVLRSSGETRSIPALLSNLGLVALQRGDLESSRLRFEEAEAAARECGNAFQRAVALGNLCELDLLDGEHERAVERGRETWTLFDAVGSDWGRAWARTNDAYCLYCSGREHEAPPVLAEALRLLGNDIDAGLVPLAAVLAGALAGRAGAHEVAVRLVAAAEAMLLVLEREPGVAVEADVRRETIAAARRALGPTGVAQAFEDGRKVSGRDLADYTREVVAKLEASARAVGRA